MKKSRNIKLALLATLFTVGIGVSLPQTSRADPPPWAPAHGYRHKHHQKVVYNYLYYPGAQVYYNPVRKLYYYPYAGGWQSGVILPPTIRLGNSVSVSLGGPVPYVYHPTVIQQYPVVIVQ